MHPEISLESSVHRYSVNLNIIIHMYCILFLDYHGFRVTGQFIKQGHLLFLIWVSLQFLAKFATWLPLIPILLTSFVKLCSLFNLTIIFIHMKFL